MRWNLEVQIVLILFHSCSLSALPFAHLPFLKDDGRKDPLPRLKANCHCHLIFAFAKSFGGGGHVIDIFNYLENDYHPSMIFIHLGKNSLTLPFAVNIEQSNKIILLPVLLEPLSMTPHHQICQKQAQNICDKDLCVQKYNHTNPQLCICTTIQFPKIYVHTNTIT